MEFGQAFNADFLYISSMNCIGQWNCLLLYYVTFVAALVFGLIYYSRCENQIRNASLINISASRDVTDMRNYYYSGPAVFTLGYVR